MCFPVNFTIFFGNFRVFHRTLWGGCVFHYHYILILVLYKAQFQDIRYQVLKGFKTQKIKTQQLPCFPQILQLLVVCFCTLVIL